MLFDEVVLLSSAVIGVSPCTGAVDLSFMASAQQELERESVVCLVVCPSTVSLQHSVHHEAMSWA